VEARVAEWVDIVAELLTEPMGDFPIGVVGRGLVETFHAEAASRVWRTPEGRAALHIVAPRGARFGDHTLSEAGRSLAVAANSELLGHHPLVRWYAKTGSADPQTLDRVPRAIAITSRSSEALELMAHHGIERQLAIPLGLPGAAPTAIVVWRGGATDFDQADLAVAARLTPLLRALRRQSEAIGEFEASEALSSLTGRELAVLVLLSRGMTSLAIASHLDCAARTVEKHLEHVYRKLGVTDRVSAVRISRGVKGVAGVAS